MTTSEAGIPVQLPTLTEVVDPSDLGARRVDAKVGANERHGLAPLLTDPIVAPPGRLTVPPAPLPVRDLPAEHELVRRVMTELERQIDVMLEYRLREMLAPLLTRVADTLVRDARAELASTLRDVVARAVASELARLRAQSPER